MARINSLFVPYWLALKLKEKGFDRTCLASFSNEDTFNIGGYYYRVTHSPESTAIAPLYQQVIDWLRETHFFHITLKHKPTSQTYGYVISGKFDETNWGVIVDKTFDKYEYYEALEKAIETALDLIK